LTFTFMKNKKHLLTEAPNKDIPPPTPRLLRHNPQQTARLLRFGIRQCR
jgi:hypothetical protein